MRGLPAEYVVTKGLRVLAWGTSILVLVWLSTNAVLAGTFDVLIWLGLGLAMVAAVAVTLHSWRSGFYAFLGWLLFEDLVRKYLGNNMIIYFGKDVLVGVTYLFFFAALRRGESPTFRPRFLFPLSLFFCLGVVQVFNPGSPSLLYGLLGLKLYFYYVLLLFVGYALLRTEKDLHQFFVFNAGLAGLIALLGIIQAIVGPTFLNPPMLAPELRPLGTMMRRAPGGEAVFRPTSVFVSDGRFAWYLVLMWVLGLGIAGYLVLRTRRGGTTVFLSVALMAGAIVMSGSRGGFMWALGSALTLAAAFLWGAPWRWRQQFRIVRALQRTLVVAGVGVVFLIFVFPQAVGARWDFYVATLSPSSPHSELAWRSWGYPVQNLLLAFQDPRWPYGHGIGVASLGGQYVSRLLGARPPELGVESGFGALILELGILGPILWLIWASVLLASGWKVIRQLKGTPYFPVGFACYWFALLLLIPFTFLGLQPYQNFIYNAYLWLLVGILFRLPSLAQENSQIPATRFSNRDVA